MKEKKVREIRLSDYPAIYVLNQDFNPTLHSFSEQKVKEKIEIITKKQTISFLFVNKTRKLSDISMEAPMNCFFPIH
ncbi:hypothetical protein [Paenibacillus sp. HGF7]|uniref:hypothetical protein n=1 Tax=Paenibacillus sp. HGF7 TaxID=944559 RepID=UPI00020D6DD0|nr:hypothetical protein HMPREF9413_3525 [Paenibacillus sp. HGF7]